jgi:hypothetical protein
MDKYIKDFTLSTYHEQIVAKLNDKLNYNIPIILENDIFYIDKITSQIDIIIDNKLLIDKKKVIFKVAKVLNIPQHIKY